MSNQNKNNAMDTEAIYEVAQHLSMRFAVIKRMDQILLRHGYSRPGNRTSSIQSSTYLIAGGAFLGSIAFNLKFAVRIKKTHR